jgi:hypothetical protein
MVRELEIIFRLHAVARKLRIARHILVFLKKLRRIPPLPIILAVSVRASAQALVPLAPTATPAATLSIIDQISLPSNREEAVPWP